MEAPAAFGAAAERARVGAARTKNEIAQGRDTGGGSGGGRSGSGGGAVVTFGGSDAGAGAGVMFGGARATNILSWRHATSQYLVQRYRRHSTSEDAARARPKLYIAHPATAAGMEVFPTPYTLHPTPYTIHPTPYTLHPTPCTLHPTPYTLHPTPYTLNPEP